MLKALLMVCKKTVNSLAVEIADNTVEIIVINVKITVHDGEIFVIPLKSLFLTLKLLLTRWNYG